VLNEVNALERAIDRKVAATAARRTRATGTVSRIEVDGTVYVLLDGAESDTPSSASSASVHPGDKVNVTVSGGRLTIDGNYSRPATDDAKAVQAYDRASNALAESARAHEAADAAEADAARAKDAADSAQESADAAQADATKANTYSNAALDQLGVVQDVAGILTWASEHGSFERTSDTSIVDGKVYFTYDSQTGDYTPVVEPDASQLSTYYELTVDEAMNDFIMAHLAVTSRGLWVLPSGKGTAVDEQHAAGYKMLLASDGSYLYDSAGVLVRSDTASGTDFASSRDWHVGGENAYILYDASEGTITIGGSSVRLGDTRKLSELLEGSAVYDHDWTKANGVYTFTARLYVGDEDVTAKVPPDHFAWTLRNESGETPLGTGRTVQVTESQAGYRGSVLGEFIELVEGQLMESGGGFVADSAGDRIQVHEHWKVAV